jgi:hypothetical protein
MAKAFSASTIQGLPRVNISGQVASSNEDEQPALQASHHGGTPPLTI